MDYTAHTVTAVSSSPGDATRIVITIIMLTIIGAAFPLAQRWADRQTSDAGVLSLTPEWILEQGKTRAKWILRRGQTVIRSFDDEAEATREFVRQMKTGVPT